jgi:LuxR family transcriptional regulator, maltose regulon positive regulatory protein
MRPKPQARPQECLVGDQALARGEWGEARAAFEAALRLRELPEALEGLGTAAWWLDLADTVFNARERAYRLYLVAEEPASAARVAVWLAWDCWAFRGEHAVANGWLQRARRLLDGQPVCPEQAWLEVREASLCLLEEGDPVRALALASEGVRIAREVRNTDLEMLGRAVQGLAEVASGAVSQGMRKLDEVNTAVIAGELTDWVAIGLSCCYMIAACERVRDYGRALEWCKRLRETCAKWGLRPLFAVCRTQYASICLWRGTWLEAESELLAASGELAASRPAMTGEALVRLAELRRRQGRLDEAKTLFDQVQSSGSGLLGQAELALDRGDPHAAAEQAERYLRRLPIQNRIDRASGLELLVRSLTDLRERDRAQVALSELSSIASVVATVPLRAAASYASGYVALGGGNIDAARRHFEDAVDLFLKSGAPFEVARSRIELARALGQLGRTGPALEEVKRAIETLAQLNAALEGDRARRVQEELAPTSNRDESSKTARAGTLSKRELEVLRLVADGLSNQRIAAGLFVSEHTVHRHLANIFDKLGVSTRTAAVSQATRRGLLP